MFIFLYGPDDYRRIQKKKEIIAEFRKKHSAFGLGVFDLEADGGIDSFLAFAGSQSIFETAKLAVLENVFVLEAEKLAKMLKPLAAEKGNTVLLAEREKPVKTLSFLLEKPSLAQKFENLEGPEWGAFIKSESQKTGLRLDESVVQFLGAVYQGNSWALVTELQKLGALKVPHGWADEASGAAHAAGAALVQKSDLDVLDLETAPNYWALINGLKSYDARTRLFALEKLFAANDPPPKIFNILAAHAGEKTPRMAEYDLAVKSGKMDYEEVLLDLAIS